MGKSYQISPNYTEDLVSFMIQMVLTISRFPRAPFAMIPLSKANEKLWGADIKIESVSPLYLQCKRSFAYPDYSKSKVVTDRKSLKLSTNQLTLFFELRNKSKNHIDYQHNVLLQLKHTLQNEGVGDALYIAPLLLDKNEYHKALYYHYLYNWRPFHFNINYPFILNDFQLTTLRGIVNFENCPILEKHIAIPPHEVVRTYKHKYSYTESGEEVCFHSPSRIEDQKKFGHYMNEFLNFKENAKMIHLEKSLKVLEDLNYRIFNSSSNNEENRLSIMERWMIFGEKLKHNFNIDQYMFFKYY